MIFCYVKYQEHTLSMTLKLRHPYIRYGCGVGKIREELWISFESIYVKKEKTVHLISSELYHSKHHFINITYINV